MPLPIFVVGKQRSGTTWLGNLLLSHPGIAGVHHPAHHGIHESAFFSHVVGRYGDLRAVQNYAEFASVMARSDYFRLAGASFEMLMELYPSSYAQVFRAVMDRLARREGASCWVEKTPMHTDCMPAIATQYPDARFVGIQRDPVDVAFSSIARYGPLPVAQRWLALARVTTDKYIMDGVMHRMKATHPRRVHLITYSDLRSRKAETLAELCDFLGVRVAEMRSSYAANSSYDRLSTATPDEKLPKTNGMERTYEALFVRHLYVTVLPTLPFSMLRGVKRVLYAESPQRLPEWFFKLCHMPL